VKKIPWLSLTLLLLSYITFSWYLHQSNQNWFVWLEVLVFTLVQTLLLTTFSEAVESFIGRWLNSDIGYFSAILLLSLFTIAALVWVHVFGRVMLIIAAQILARLDLQHSGFNKLQALLFLSAISILGIGAGWAIHGLINSQQLPNQQV
jgi:hypothetical protein